MMTTLLHLAYAVAGAAAGGSVGLAVAGVRCGRLRAACTQARYQATHDPLTGLVNRAGWHHHAPTVLTRAANAGVPAVLLLIDLDGFKAINDRHGHPTGDRLLQVTARRLAALIGTAGLVCRLGGDEYAALAIPPGGDDTPQAWADRTAGQIRRRLAAPITITGGPVTVGASVGTAILSPGVGRASDLTAALHHADEAMYRDKHHRTATAAIASG